jgi:hypothetical protein
MIRPRVGFIVFGVHKDGLQDPLGAPFIDDELVAGAKQALRAAGVELVEYPVILATKREARECLGAFKKRDDLDAIVLFSGTWVWAAHLIGALRDFSGSGKGIVLWTNPGSQGWRPVGGLVMHGALKEVGIAHRFVYGGYEDPAEVVKVASYCRASAMVNRLNMSTCGAFGGRGMGQTCGVADPRAVTVAELRQAREHIQPRFAEPIPEGDEADRSIRLYVALKKIVQREAFDFYTIQSFPGLGDDYSATSFAQSMMLEDGVGTSTLSDFNTALTVKLLMDLGTERPYYGDLQHIDKRNNEIKIIGDGACPPSLAGEAGPARFAHHGIPTEGAAGGISVQLVCKPGKGVLARMGRTDGELEMALARCTVYEPAPEVLEARKIESGIPFWPHAFVTAHCDIDALLEAWNNEYAVLGYGENLYNDLVAFCELTGIRAITL